MFLARSSMRELTSLSLPFLPRSRRKTLNATLTARGTATALALLAHESLILSSAASLLYSTRRLSSYPAHTLYVTVTVCEMDMVI
jgi:hypothetical protein